MLVLVLQNEVAAMTGGQKVPDLRKVVESFVPDVSFFDMGTEGEKEDSDREKESKNQTIEKIEEKSGNEVKKQISSSKLPDLIREKLALPGISVIFIKARCGKY